MVLTIKNFESQHVGPGVTETAPTNLVGVAGILKATLTWTSATGESGVTWTEEKLVRKEGSAPQGSMDGTTVATITTKNTYATTGYEDTGLDSTKTYYYKVFAVYDNGTEKGSSDVNVTPLHPAPIIIESDLTTATLESLIADGWTGIDSSAGYVLDSNGLKGVTSGSCKSACLYKNISDIQYEIDNIEIETTGYVASGSWSGRITSCFTNDTFWGYFLKNNASGNTNSGYNGYTSVYRRNSSNEIYWLRDQTINLPSGNYTTKLKVYLKTGLIVLDTLSEGVNKFHREGNLPSDAWDIIKENKICMAEVERGSTSGTNNSIKYAKLTINF